MSGKWLEMSALMVLAAVLAGCSGGAAETTTKASPAAVPAIEADPNDPYNAYLTSDLMTINSAQLELEYKCYADSGYPQFLEVLPAQKADQFVGMAETPDFKTTFASFAELPWFPSEDYARAAGFGHSFPARAAFAFVNDPSFGEVRQTCDKSALDAMSGSQDLIDGYTKLGNDLSEALTVAARQNKDRLTKDVFVCMSKGKYPVDDNGPNKQPIWGVDFGVPLGSQPEIKRPDVSNGGPVQVVPMVPPSLYIPTPQESDAASAMYKCSIESGAHDAWLNAMKSAKENALAKNETLITELNPQIKALAKAAVVSLQAKK